MKKKIEKSIIFFGVITVAILMASSATALPAVNGDVANIKVEELANISLKIEKIQEIKNKISDLKIINKHLSGESIGLLLFILLIPFCTIFWPLAFIFCSLISVFCLVTGQIDIALAIFLIGCLFPILGPLVIILKYW